jgi:hypothetical protein
MTHTEIRDVVWGHLNNAFEDIERALEFPIPDGPSPHVSDEDFLALVLEYCGHELGLQVGCLASTRGWDVSALHGAVRDMLVRLEPAIRMHALDMYDEEEAHHART